MTEDTSPENLRKFLESDDPAMVRMGLSMAKGSGVPEELWGLVLGVKLWDQDASIRKEAATLLKKEAPPDLREKMKANLFRRNTARISDLDKLQDICEELSSLGLNDARPIERIIQMFGRNWSPMATVLGKIGDARAVEPLIKALEGEEALDTQRANIVIALGKIGDARAMEPLIEVLSDTRIRESLSSLSWVKEESAKALAKIVKASDIKEKENVIKFLENDDPGMVRMGVSMLKGILEE